MTTPSKPITISDEARVAAFEETQLQSGIIPQGHHVQLFANSLTAKLREELGCGQLNMTDALRSMEHVFDKRLLTATNINQAQCVIEIAAKTLLSDYARDLIRERDSLNQQLTFANNRREELLHIIEHLTTFTMHTERCSMPAAPCDCGLASHLIRARIQLKQGQS